MDRIKGAWARLRRVKPRTWLLALGGIVVLLLLFAGGLYAWDYTNSSYFCGTTCHTMPPHYESYLRSPHARVECVECHIGRTSFGVQFTRKAVDAQFVWAYLTGLYEFPLHAKGLQPARESCEKCHWPEKFSWDKVVTKTNISTDEKNTPVETALVMKTGGGSSRTGLGRGIHWHIENPIDFYYTDEFQQEIPYIEVTNPDGTKTVYSDIENPLTEAELAKLPKRTMDCIDCHNRVSHTFPTPAEAMDSLLSTGQIDPNIPNIKSKGVEVLASPFGSSPELAQQAIDRVNAYYEQNFPDYYKENTQAVQNAVATLKEWYPKLHFPEQALDWSTHPDNLGHKDWPGCFRCHDGKHFTEDRKEAVRLECNVCHSIPVVYTEGQSAPAISLEQVNEPDSHKTTTWLLEHRTRFDTTCQDCHDTRNAGGSDNTSFCSNSACHGTKWEFAGFDAPALAQVLQPPVRQPSDPNAPPSKIPHPIGGNPDCQICHGLNAIVLPMPDDHEGRTNDLCLACHDPSVLPEGFDAEAGKPPSIPHALAGQSECLGCHNTGAASMPQIPQSHKDENYTNGQCTTCHQPAKEGETTLPALPQIPPDHATSACAACHSAGLAGAPKSPDDHANYADTQCSTCHSSATAPASPGTSETPAASGTRAATATPPPPPLPGIPADHATSACAACHATGALSSPKFPDDHAGFPDKQCEVCHKREQ